MTTTATETRSHVPLSLVLQQGPMLRALGRIVVQSALPAWRSAQNPAAFEPARMTIRAPSAELVASYAAWCGVATRNPRVLPPHLFSQWALQAAVKVLEQTMYPLAGIINQGVSMRINGELPAGEPLQVTARLQSLEESGGRARVAIEISSGPERQPDAVVATLHVVFMLAGRKAKQAPRDAAREPEWSTLGTWHATADDGLRFAILTGDFNPIHWIGLAGRLSPFKRKVLHGFGMFVRSYEVVAASETVTEMDVRFVKPVALPSGALRVQTAPVDADGWHPLRLIGDVAQVHLAGRYRSAR